MISNCYLIFNNPTLDPNNIAWMFIIFSIEMQLLRSSKLFATTSLIVSLYLYITLLLCNHTFALAFDILTFFIFTFPPGYNYFNRSKTFFYLMSSLGLSGESAHPDAQGFFGQKHVIFFV